MLWPKAKTTAIRAGIQVERHRHLIGQFNVGDVSDVPTEPCEHSSQDCVLGELTDDERH